MEKNFNYWNQVSDEASVENFRRDEHTKALPLPTAPALLSEEALPENGTMLDFKAFAREYPERLFPLLDKLRPEFKEIFIEYYILEKSQYFIGPAHGQIQTRVWQNLRIIEQALGSLIVLGIEPTPEAMHRILCSAGIEETKFGLLSNMIALYAKTQSYADVAKALSVPVPVIRKTFRPAITTLLASKDLKAVALGSYLRYITHRASLTDKGFSKRYLARLKKVKALTFDAPAPEHTNLIEYGQTDALRDTPWCMFEIKTEHRIHNVLREVEKSLSKIFKKQAVQVFAPIDSTGELQLGYILARSMNDRITHTLVRVAGILEMAAIYTDDGRFQHAVTVPNRDVQPMIDAYISQTSTQVETGDFVEILTGPAARYCGVVTSATKNSVNVTVNFLSGRKFTVHAKHSSVKTFGAVSEHQRSFWGLIQSGEIN